MKQNKQDEREKNKMDAAVFRALASIYTGVFLMDLENDTYKTVQAPKRITDLLGKIISAQKAINYAIQQTVSKDELLDVLSFVNLHTLPERMQSENCLTIEYKGTISGWNRGSFIEAERDSSGKLTKVLYTYQIIDKDRKRELENLEKMKEDYARTEKAGKEERLALENDKKELTDDLKFHNDFNQVILEQMECGVLAYTIPGRELLQINREALRIYGWKNESEAAENLGKKLEYVRLLHTEDSEKLFKLREQKGSVRYQFIVNSGQKNERRVLAESKSLSGRYGGTVIITTFVEITHVVSLEKEKGILEDKNTSLADKNTFLATENAELQCARDAVYTMMSAGSYFCTYAEDGESLVSIKFSDALRKLYGYSGKEDAPDTWDMWLKGAHPDDRKYVADQYLAALRDRTGNTKYSVTYRAVQKDGTIRWFRAAGYVIRREDGTAEFCYGLITDIDEQKKASDMVEKALEEAKRANAAKTSFLARMSHDIRTPMNGIMGLIDINEKHADDVAFTSQNRRKAKVAANHLLSLINDVLQLSKLDDSNIELSEAPFDMTSLLDDIFTITEMRAQENGITITRKRTDSVQEYPYLWGSPLHVRQIYINLMGNSIKYNKKNGSIVCSTSAERIDEDHVLFRMIVKDTGIGISEEFLPHLFEPFAMEREDMTGRSEGTGLGLSIVKQLVEKMGGSIQVESKVNEGSCFTVDIPFRIASEDEVIKAKEPEEPGDIKGKHILLVEDNELNMDISEIILTDAGAAVTKAVNGQQAVDLFQENRPGTFDVILMDIMMPVMNGYEATRCIRSLKRSDAKKIPIIAITANAFSEDIGECLAAGMDAHIAKPIDISVLKNTMLKYL